MPGNSPALKSVLNSSTFPAPQSAREAVQIQQELRRLVCLRDGFDNITDVRTFAGIDVGYDIHNNMSQCALVIMDRDRDRDRTSLTVQETIIVTAPTVFPYIPGLLSFREAPVILKALGRLSATPDILFIDGQGIAHPRRLGIAAHVGVLTGIPAIGIAKSILCGTHAALAPEKGAAAPLMHKGEKIGTAYRSRTGVKPIYISPGHRISHESAVTLVAQSLTRYKLPEPTRIADKLSKTVPEKQAKTK